MSEAPKAFVTGGSRGIGAETAIAFAENGWDVGIGATRETKELNKTLDRLGSIGVKPLVTMGDITSPKSRSGIIENVLAWAGGDLRALILNAAGGMEADKDENYGMLINRDAQVALAEGFSSGMAPNNTIVFITSHWGHWYDRGLKMPPYEMQGKTYDVVASSKYAGEMALRGMIPDLAKYDSRLLVVSGGFVPDTIVGRLGKRGDPDFAQRQAEVGNAPDAREMGERIFTAVADPRLSSGELIIVGADEKEFLKNESLEA